MKNILCFFILFFLLNISTAHAQSWSALGTGTNGDVYATVEYNGELYIGGNFTMAGGISAKHIAKWNGTNWDSLQSGVDDEVWSLCVYNGELFAGGYFDYAGGNYSPSIARWNGSNWSTAGSGMAGLSVYAMTIYNGKLFAGGSFYAADGVPAKNIAQWNGMNWDSVGSGTNGPVEAFTIYNGKLWAGGKFTAAGGAPTSFIASWNDTAWASLGLPPVHYVAYEGVYALSVYQSDLYAGGYFDTICGTHIYNLGKWDGTNWSSLNVGAGDYVYALLSNSSLLYVGSYMSVPENHIGAWNGSSWSALNSGLTGGLVATIGLYNGDLIAGGQFSHAGTLVTQRVAEWSIAADVGEIANENFVNIFPNPNNGTFSVNVKTISPSMKIEIYNSLGEIVAVKNIVSENTPVDISNEATGIYFYKVISKDGMVSSGKFVRE